MAAAFKYAIAQRAQGDFIGVILLFFNFHGKLWIFIQKTHVDQHFFLHAMHDILTGVQLEKFIKRIRCHTQVTCLRTALQCMAVLEIEDIMLMAQHKVKQLLTFFIKA